MSIREELQQLVELMNQKPDRIATLHATYEFKLGEAGSYRVVFQDGLAVLEDASSSDSSSADCTLILSEINLRKLLKDELNTTVAFMTGGLKVEGKLGLAMKLQDIVKAYTKH